MATRSTADWMLAEAISALAQAERMQRQLFRLRASQEAPEPCWEPLTDVIETDAGVLVTVALPGVDPDDVVSTIDDGMLVVAGRRALPPELRHAVIHRLELPQGRFERRIPLPPGRYAIHHSARNGCLVFALSRIA
ncbi:Hsp20/alpha crystallin family protein [Chelatococcus reniformis]|uniref:Heat-shock protein Hsp20 n=1 Tax=Chelatococcus reniformis TaxID=1494448 RepID=A0A916UEY0_9HYPH|nr:Hsp20/alpha crystallin family protein [Chelatococcus reniformis]GGC70207.1 heat-shock protein Hsp20 [Chelatococcus reniformis]